MHVRVGGLSKLIHSESYSLPSELDSSRVLCPKIQDYKSEQRSRISRKEKGIW